MANDATRALFGDPNSPPPEAQGTTVPAGYDVTPVDYQGGEATPVDSGGALQVIEQGALTLLGAAIPTAARTGAKQSIVARFGQAIMGAVPMAGPWGLVVKILALAMFSEIGEFIITKAYEAITGAFTGTKEPGDGGAPAIRRNSRNPEAAALLLNKVAKAHPGFAEALAFIATGGSSADALAFLSLGANARAFVTFFEAATDNNLMQVVTFKVQNGPIGVRQQG